MDSAPALGEIVVTHTRQEPQEGDSPWESNYPPSLLPGEKININTAQVADLQRLPAIGQGRAEDMVAYRCEHGAFTSVAQLLEIPGIGKTTLSQVRNYITLD